MNNWEKLGYVAAVFNPVPTGLVAGYYLSKDKSRKLQKTGRNVTSLSLVWFAIVMLISLLAK